MTFLTPPSVHGLSKLLELFNGCKTLTRNNTRKKDRVSILSTKKATHTDTYSCQFKLWSGSLNIGLLR